MIIEYVINFGNLFTEGTKYSFNGGYQRKISTINDNIIHEEFWGYLGDGAPKQVLIENARNMLTEFIDNNIKEVSSKINFDKIKDFMNNYNVKGIELDTIKLQYKHHEFKLFIKIYKENNNKKLEEE